MIIHSCGILHPTAYDLITLIGERDVSTSLAVVNKHNKYIFTVYMIQIMYFFYSQYLFGSIYLVDVPKLNIHDSSFRYQKNCFLHLDRQGSMILSCPTNSCFCHIWSIFNILPLIDLYRKWPYISSTIQKYMTYYIYFLILATWQIIRHLDEFGSFWKFNPSDPSHEPQ